MSGTCNKDREYKGCASNFKMSSCKPEDNNNKLDVIKIGRMNERFHH
jgi:hypothetical protein